MSEPRAPGTGRSGSQPSGGQPAGSQPGGGQPAGSQPASGQPAGSQPASGRPAGSQPAGSQPISGSFEARQPDSFPALARRALKSRLVWPALTLVVLLLLNVSIQHNFFAIRIQDGHLFGSLIDILRNGAPTVLVAIGMTLVIATRGIDLSVGAVVAISGALAVTIIRDSPNPGSLSTVLVACAVAVALSAVLGAWNGLLVSVFGIQPIIATLILLTAGRGIAQLITGGQILSVSSAPYKVIGGGYWFTLPASIIIVVAMCAIATILTRKTALGLLIESVGINPEASRLAGVGSRGIIWMVYIFSGICAGIAGLMVSSNVTAADANSAGLWIELDAILAVVLGGTSLAGGRYSLAGAVMGAFVIQTLTTTVYSIGIAPEITLVFKAIVVILVCLLQSPKFIATIRPGRKRPPPPAVEPARLTVQEGAA